MIGQVVGKFSGFIFVCYVLFLVFYYVSQTTHYERYVTYKIIYATVMMDELYEPNYVTDFDLPDGRRIQVKGATLRADKAIKAVVNKNRLALVEAAIVGLVFILIVFFSVLMFIYKTGASLR